MSCEEVRIYLAGGGTAKMPLALRPALEKHIASCPECAGFREHADQLRASFDLLRARTPSVPRSLDQKVLASYREHIRGLAEVGRPRRPARRLAYWALRWASAAAFALAVSYAEITWFARSTQAPPPRSPMRAISRLPSADEAAARARASARRAAGERRQTKRLATRARDEKGPLARSGGGSGFAPVGGFRGLMYCDELSCAGAMDVIRVEVPVEAVGVALGRRPGGAPVEADVLVGPDGVARGIRLVQ